MFTVYGNKGFTVKFDNGYEVSVMFGAANYCGNHLRENGTLYSLSCDTAEVAIFKNGRIIPTIFTPDDENPVIGWQSTTDVLTIMDWASRQ